MLPFLTAAAAIGVWAVAVRVSHTTVFPSPAAVVRALITIEADGRLQRHIVDSLWRVGFGYGAAVVVGLSAGLLMGLFQVVAWLFEPVVQLLRPISPLAWIPIAVLFFGISGAAAVSVIFVAAVLPIVVTTMAAAQSASDVHLGAGRNFGLSSLQLIWRVIVPAGLPRIFTGLRVALGTAWLVLVAAEMIAVDSGLGYMVVDARNAGKRYDQVVAAMAVIGLIGLALDIGLRQYERLGCVRWSVRSDRR